MAGAAPRRCQRQQIRGRATPPHRRARPLAKRLASLHRGFGNAGQYERPFPPRIDPPHRTVVQHAAPGQETMDASIDGAKQAVQVLVGRRYHLVEPQSCVLKKPPLYVDEAKKPTLHDRCDRVMS